MKTRGLLKNRRVFIFILMGIFLFLTPMASLQAYIFPGDCRDAYERMKLSNFASECADADSESFQCMIAYDEFQRCLKYDQEKKAKEDLSKYRTPGPGYAKGGPLPPGVNYDELVEKVKQEINELFEEANKLWKAGKEKEGNKIGDEIHDKRHWLQYLKEQQQKQLEEVTGAKGDTGAAGALGRIGQEEVSDDEARRIQEWRELEEIDARIRKEIEEYEKKVKEAERRLKEIEELEKKLKIKVDLSHGIPLPEDVEKQEAERRLRIIGEWEKKTGRKVDLSRGIPRPEDLEKLEEIKGGEAGTGAAVPGGFGGGAPGEIAVVPTAQQVISGTQPTKTEEYEEGVAGFNILLQPHVDSLDYGGSK